MKKEACYRVRCGPARTLGRTHEEEAVKVREKVAVFSWEECVGSLFITLPDICEALSGHASHAGGGPVLSVVCPSSLVIPRREVCGLTTLRCPAAPEPKQLFPHGTKGHAHRVWPLAKASQKWEVDSKHLVAPPPICVHTAC